MRSIKTVVWMLPVFGFFWLLNNGFSFDNIWQTLQALFFTILLFFVFKYPKINLAHWFLVVTMFYLISMMLEILKMTPFQEIFASTGFGILIIVIVCETFRRISSYER